MRKQACDKSSRRRGRDRTSRAQPIQQTPYRQPKKLLPPTALISDDELEMIHLASLQVLEEIGLEVVLPEARERFKAAGAEVRGERVRFAPEFIMQSIATAPSNFTFHARNPAHSINVGGDWLAFGSISSPPNCADLDNGRRPGNRADFQKLLKLAQYFNCIHFIGGYPVEPIDIHPSVRHLHAFSDMAQLSDKPLHGYSLGKERIVDSIEMARIIRGISQEQLLTEPSLWSIINTNSPLKLDIPMMQGVIEMSSRGQIICITPFTLAGAMAPVTISGALVQQNAEALAGIAFTQIVRAGAPVIYGGFTSNVDMKSGAPAFGTPEYMKSALVGGQLARRYNLPYRSSNTCAANAVDAQAAYESMFSLWGAVMGGVNMLKHGAGWMEGGLVASFEKFIVDCDMLMMVQEFLKPLDLSPQALGLDAIREVGPGGHFFGCQHTLERYQDAFYAPMISDWRNFEQWQSVGSPEAAGKANRVWKQALEDYQEPAMDEAISEELAAFIAKRVEEGGAPTDF